MAVQSRDRHLVSVVIFTRYLMANKVNK